MREVARNKVLLSLRNKKYDADPVSKVKLQKAFDFIEDPNNSNSDVSDYLQREGFKFNPTSTGVTFGGKRHKLRARTRKQNHGKQKGGFTYKMMKRRSIPSFTKISRSSKRKRITKTSKKY